MNTESLPETTFHCPLCNEPLPVGATECTKCDWVPGYGKAFQPKPLAPHDVAAVGLSLMLPGAGHFFKGYRVEAGIILCGLPVVAIFAFAFTMFFGWLLIPTYWIAVAADAYLRKDLQKPILPKH